MIREEAMVIEWSSDPHPADMPEMWDQTAVNQEIQNLRNFIAGQFAQQAALLQGLSRQVELSRSGKLQLPNGAKGEEFVPNGTSPPRSPLLTPKSAAYDPKSEEPELLFSPDTSREATAEAVTSDGALNEQKQQKRRSLSSKNSSLDGDAEAEFYQKKNADANRKKYAVSSATGELEMHTAEDDQPPHINWRSPKNVAQYFSRSSVFIYGIMFVILFNLISLGIEVDIAAREGSNNVPIHFDYMNLIVVFIFVVEITVNFIANGPWGFCCSGDKWWNFFDLIIVILSVVETVVSFMANAVPSSQVSPSHLRFMRPIRLARALRGVRVMRLFRYVGALRTLLLSIMSSIASLFWTIVLLVLLFYSFGVLVTQLVSDHCELQPLPMGNGTATSFACQGRGEESTPYFYMGPSRYWSSVIESMLTLFMAISGGIDWDDGLTALRDIPLAFAALIMYIIITVFTVVNVVTGVFCNTAIESAAADKDIAVMKQMRKQAAQVQVLKHVFNEINNQSTDTINMQDLKDAMSAHKLSSFFESMGISTGDVWTLFKVIDTDGSGTIDMDEFVSGCMRLHGPAKSLDIAKMEFEHEVTRDSIASLEKNVSDMQELLMAFLGKDGKNGTEQGSPASTTPKKTLRNASFAV